MHGVAASTNGAFISGATEYRTAAATTPTNVTRTRLPQINNYQRLHQSWAETPFPATPEESCRTDGLKARGTGQNFNHGADIWNGNRMTANAQIASDTPFS